MKPVILVVDDDIAMGELLSDVLGAHAFEVLVCQTGGDALARVAQRADIALATFTTTSEPQPPHFSVTTLLILLSMSAAPVPITVPCSWSRGCSAKICPSTVASDHS